MRWLYALHVGAAQRFEWRQIDDVRTKDIQPPDYIGTSLKRRRANSKGKIHFERLINKTGSNHVIVRLKSVYSIEHIESSYTYLYKL